MINILSFQVVFNADRVLDRDNEAHEESISISNLVTE
jgi:hypothetical protein